jgi:uncharacterized protein
MSISINRRKFFSKTALSAAGLMLGASVPGFGTEGEHGSSELPGSAAYNVMKEAMKYRKMDAHIHALLSPSVTPELLIDFADRLGVEKMMISLPITREIATHEDVKAANDKMIKILKQYPERFRPMFTLNVQYQKESLEEIKRCVDNGLVGLKVYYQVKLNDPLYYPVLEKMIDLKMITLMHSYIGLGRSSYRTKYGNLYPNESTPMDFVDTAKRYPEALLQFAHTGGGGDWEFECKCMKDYPNIYVDVSGSNNEDNMINYCVKYLGEDRLFFGSDNCYYQAVSKILSADLTETQRKKIFFDNYNNVLRKGGYHVA